MKKITALALALPLAFTDVAQAETIIASSPANTFIINACTADKHEVIAESIYAATERNAPYEQQVVTGLQDYFAKLTSTTIVGSEKALTEGDFKIYEWMNGGDYLDVIEAAIEDNHLDTFFAGVGPINVSKTPVPACG